MASPKPAPSADEPSRLTNCDHDAALREQADALRRLADVFEAGFASLHPAAEMVSGLGGRLEKLCSWLQSRWPWVWLFAAAFVVRTVNAAPEDVPRLLHAMAALAKALGELVAS